jgi:hypothetical protein
MTTGRVAYRRLRAALVAVLCGTVLAACGIPRSSDVLEGRRVGDNVAPRARIVMNPPAVGSSQDVIARDFIRSGAAFQETGDDQQVVGRSYLAPGSADLWRPTALSTTVYDSRTPLTIEPLPSDQVRLTITAVATIDETGRYRELPPESTVSTVFGMTKVDGEWRIKLPDDGFGLWLNTDDFDRVFAAYEVNYVLTARKELVPDVRWFPVGPRLPTALARAQLAAVPGYLTGVVDTAIPQGTRLAVDAVQVDPAGVATVTLTNSAQTIDPARRRPMWAQFLATLTQAPEVVAVSIEVQGIGKIPVSSLPTAVSSLSDLGFTVAPTEPATSGLLRSKDTLERINPQLLDESSPPPVANGSKPVPGLPKIPETYVNLAMSGDGNDIAGVSASRAELARWRGGNGVTVPPFGTALTNPTYASDGRLWVAGQASGATTIWTFDASKLAGGPAEVAASWLNGRQVVNLGVAPDATRVAVISKLPNDTDYRLDVAGVIRDDSGTATALAEPYRQGEPLTQFVDVMWIDQMTMAVLAREKDGATLRPYRVDLGQGVGLRRVGQLDLDQTLIKELPDATSLTSRGGVRGLIVMTPQAAYLRAGNAWAQQENVTEIVVGGT